MMKDNLLWVKIKSDKYYNVLLKLNEIGITIYDNKKIKDYILLKTNYSDYKKIKKYLVSYDVSINSKSGLNKIKEEIKKYRVFLSGIILGFFLLLLTNNMIFKIEVKSANQSIRTLVMQELNKNGLKTLRLKKNHQKIEKIVEKILDDNKNVLEWLEIKYDGLIMVVNVVEKTIYEEDKSYDNCNIIASSDAKITSLNLYRGVNLKEINDYVLKGEVIISGSITHNEEVKNLVCASGEVYGEVWYKVKVTIPFLENYTSYTGKNRYNLNVKINDDKYTIFKSRITNKKDEEINLYKLNDFEINLVKEREYETRTRKLTEEIAYNKGIKKALEKVQLKLQDDEEILLKKVLKKEIKDSTIYLEVFIVTKENIGVLQVVQGGVSDDSKSSS